MWDREACAPWEFLVELLVRRIRGHGQLYSNVKPLCVFKAEE
jgi:hypothetical protein